MGLTEKTSLRRCNFFEEIETLEKHRALGSPVLGEYRRRYGKRTSEMEIKRLVLGYQISVLALHE